MPEPMTAQALYDLMGNEIRRMLEPHNQRHTRNLKIRDWLWFFDKANVVGAE